MIDVTKDQKSPEWMDLLSEAVVLAEADDLQSLADFHTAWETVGVWGENTDQVDVMHKAREAIELIEKIILNEVSNKPECLQTVCQITHDLLCEMRQKKLNQEALSTFLFASPPQSSVNNNGNNHKLCQSLPPNVEDHVFLDFLQRQDGVLAEMEAAIISLENGESVTGVATLRRIMHTMKGEVALLGLEDVTLLVHTIEDVLEASSINALIDALLRAKDWLQAVFSHYQLNAPYPESHQDLIASLVSKAASSQVKSMDQNQEDECTPNQVGYNAQSPVYLDADGGLMQEFILEAGEHLDSVDTHLLALEDSENNEEAINAVFRGFHTIKGVSGFLNLEAIGSLAHDCENLLDSVRKGQTPVTSDLIDLTFEAVDMMKCLVSCLSDALATDGLLNVNPDLPGLIFKLRQFLVTGATKDCEKTISEISTPVCIKASVSDSKLLGGQQPLELDGADTRPSPPASRTGKLKEILKVDAEKLDYLIETIGELVITETMVAQSPELADIKSPQLSRQLAQLDKTARQLQEIGTALRMVSIKPTFQKMARLVRDLAKKGGKDVQFRMSGEETELDKSLVDQIGDPLVHLVRNAVDHGIEQTPEERQKAGKSQAGLVQLRAYHQGGNIFIEIRDDGRGLNKEAIIKKAIERDIINEASELSTEEIYTLILQPGFSTAQKITNVSGRGVGMDVVKKSIEALRGELQIDSAPGKGTTFTIRLPLTLAVIDGMVIQVGEERYIIPTAQVTRCIKPSPDDICTMTSQAKMLTTSNGLVPLFELSKLFDVGDGGDGGDIGSASVIVQVEHLGKFTGLLVDTLIGQQQIVIKSLGERLENLMGIAGGAIMSDGRIGLIIDVEGVIALAHRNQADLVAVEPYSDPILQN